MSNDKKSKSKIMNTKYFLLIVIFIYSLSAGAQVSRRPLSAHNLIHKEQLANAKTRIDKSLISEIIKEDIESRENSKMSAASLTMIQDLLLEANKHVGKPYRSGSKGPGSFDCSGFSSYIYKQFGYSLSPSSRTQDTQGIGVNREDLREGDLVFFTSRRSGNGVGHVGIVVSANNETGEFSFIHAARTGIKVDKCQGYYANRYIGARRIITE